ncbi:MAG: hypothetical protein MZV70_20260 [Desulfobacterales bacterium]|nr:hypothetical protein [Desulfobacterales bacterium]
MKALPGCRDRQAGCTCADAGRRWPIRPTGRSRHWKPDGAARRCQRDRHHPQAAGAGGPRVALVYPNRYHVGMSNLGLQSVYGLLNGFDDVVCERVFLPEDGEPAAGRLTTLESGRPVAEADIVAFSISFESDYPHLLALLERAGIPLRAARADRAPSPGDRRRGGLLPEPGADRRRSSTAFLIGEAEVILPALRGGVHAPAPNGGRCSWRSPARCPAPTCPRFYRVTYTPDGDHRRV